MVNSSSRALRLTAINVGSARSPSFKRVSGDAGGKSIWAAHAPPGLVAFSLGPGLEDFVLLSHPLETSALPEWLPRAEREVAQGIIEGLSNEAIARRRKVSVRTVANQVVRLLRRFRVGSRAELVRVVLSR